MAKAHPSVTQQVAQWRPPESLDNGQERIFGPGEIVERIHAQTKNDADGFLVIEWISTGEMSKIHCYGSGWLTLDVLGRYDYHDPQGLRVRNDSLVSVVVEWVILSG